MVTDMTDDATKEWGEKMSTNVKYQTWKSVK